MVFIILFIFVILSPSAYAAEDVSNQSTQLLGNWSRLNDLYFENVRLSEADTYTGYAQLRSGFASQSKSVEVYAVSRIGADSRTNMDPSGGIYNDNFVFAGAGIDYLGLLPGVRATFQAGGSFDLSSKIHEGGFDLRTGFQTYHEIPLAGDRLYNEIYSEALYFQRYINILGSVQYRTVYSAFRWKKGNHGFEIAPVLNLVAAADSSGLDYNRFAEARLGPRLVYRGPISLALTPQYVWGTRWARPTDLPYYTDFRILLTGFISL